MITDVRGTKSTPDQIQRGSRDEVIQKTGSEMATIMSMSWEA